MTASSNKSSAEISRRPGSSGHRHRRSHDGASSGLPGLPEGDRWAGHGQAFRCQVERDQGKQLARFVAGGAPRSSCRPAALLAEPGSQYDRSRNRHAAAHDPRAARRFGFDYAIIYPTLGFYMVDESDEEIRRASCRAHNTMAAELFREHADRLTTPACIPTHTPDEAIEELDYAVNTLGLKAAMIANLVHRPIAAVARAAPELATYATWTDCLGLDSEYDYDPFWAKCIELGVAPTAHSRGQGRNVRRSVTNFMHNQIGHFSEAGDAFAPSALLRWSHAAISRTQRRLPGKVALAGRVAFMRNWLAPGTSATRT